jgi:ATP-dependent DNA helicase PIF1
VTRPSLEITPEFARGLAILEETGKTLFLTGRAGTGKSTFLELFRSRSGKKTVVLAPTGVAALNVRGQTIHSFFGFKPQVSLSEARSQAFRARQPDLYRKLDLIVIDEISMVRADLLDCMDAFLKAARRSDAPFGGAQMAMIGDLYQLPPVVRGQDRETLGALYRTPYFFSAKVFAQYQEEPDEIEFLELEKIFRQSDRDFIDLLESIRHRTVTPEQLALLNQRVRPELPDGETIVLVATNEQAERINQARLIELSEDQERTYWGKLTGDFSERDLPTEEALTLRLGARVMFLVNDPDGWWVNGSLGTVTGLEDEAPTVRLDESGEEVEVYPFSWESIHARYNQERQEIESEVVGRFTQVPLKLAWAITIHKSQGKPFDRVVIDPGRGAFTTGQTYVALSRCRTLDGITLRKPLRMSDIRLDYAIVRFLTQFQYRLAERAMPLEDRIDALQQAIREEREVRITYLKAQDQKSHRRIRPLRIEEMIYAGVPFLGLEAYCYERKEKRTFRVDRILAIEMEGEE